MSEVSYYAKGDMTTLFLGLQNALVKKKPVDKYTDSYFETIEVETKTLKETFEVYDMGNGLMITRETFEVDYTGKHGHIPKSFDMHVLFYFNKGDSLMTDKKDIIEIAQRLAGIELPQDVVQKIVNIPKEEPILLPVPPFREYSKIITDVKILEREAFE
jgi:hypothetical protein